MMSDMIDVRAADPSHPAEVLVVGWGAGGLVVDGLPTTLLPLAVRESLESWDERPEVGQAAVLPLPGSVPAKLVLVGIGSGSVAELRRAGAAAARATGSVELTVAVPADPPGTAALIEGLALAAYGFRLGAPVEGLRSVRVLTDDEAALERGRALAGAGTWARDLTNTPASIKTPAWLAAQAIEELSPLGVRVTERDESWLAEQGFGGVLAVGGGSAAPPRLIEASWRPRGAGRDHLVVVGKGITFDTGGLNIKPGDAMRPMHTDMGGAAAALAALRAIATLRAKVWVTVLVPAAQNSVSGSAMRPSDVIRHYGGRTSEVLNTDAEGRLVLADAMAYALARLRPSVLVDVATLTGAMKVALGLRTAGVLGTDEALAAELRAAGLAADEPVWRLPLNEDYAESLHSDVADAQNAPGNPGTITAALFLRPFAGDVAWAHLDIAGPARSGVDVDVLTRGATGFGARLLTEWLLARAA
jgi:leucyl aminopeptidase